MIRAQVTFHEILQAYLAGDVSDESDGFAGCRVMRRPVVARTRRRHDCRSFG
jgi:hypothetical protein